MLALSIVNLTRTIVYGTVAAFFLFIFVIIPTLMFFAALFEKQRTAPLRPGQWTPSIAAVRVLNDALARGFTQLGSFIEGRKGHIALALSEDRTILLMVSDSKVNRRVRLLTRLPGDLWIITADIVGVHDLSGTHRQEMLPKAELGTLLHYHRQRIAESGQTAMEFPAENLEQFLCDQEHNRCRLMESAGLIRMLRGREDTWVYTVRGAWKVVSAQVAQLANLNKLNARTKAKAREAEWRSL